MNTRTLACTTAALLLVWCSGFDRGGPSQSGELGAGRFIYQCAGDSDAFCRNEEEDFPDAIAVGSRFDVDFEGGFSGPYGRVAAAVPGFLETSISDFRAIRPGQSALLASNAGEVVDLTHIVAVRVAGLQVRAGEGWRNAGELELAVGDSLLLEAQPHDSEGDVLAGALEYAWEVSDLSIASLSGPDGGAEMLLKASAVGETTVRVDAGEAAGLSLRVVVTPGGPGLDGGVVDTDGGQDEDGGL